MCGLCPESTIRFLGKKGLKNAFHRNFLQTKVVTNHNTQLLVQRLFDRPTGVASVLAQFGFLVKSTLKMHCTKYFYQTEVVINQNLQLLGYVTFFNILHHYGVIEASLICSVEKVLYRLTEQIFMTFQ